MRKRKYDIEIDEIKNQKIVIKGNKLTLEWVSIPTISKNCILVYSQEKAGKKLRKELKESNKILKQMEENAEEYAQEKIIEGEIKLVALAIYLNKWGDENKHPEGSFKGRITEYGEGYKDCIKDIFKKFPQLSKLLDKYYRKKEKKGRN